MKNLVLTIAVGKKYEAMAQMTHPRIEDYAERIGADFRVVTESQCSTPHWEKLHHIYGLLSQYERILYLDTDILLRDDCPDLFGVVPSDELGIFNESPWTGGRVDSMREACISVDDKLPRWDGRYFNTGVMVVPRQWREIFRHPGDEKFNFYEQGYLNYAIAKTLSESGNEKSIHELHYKYNRMTCMDRFTGEERFASYLIHYAGYPSLDFVLGVIQKDIEKWESDSPDYQYRRHILVDVQGGLGDQVCAEPVIRFMRKHVYPDADIVVRTHWPELFRHIKVDVCHHDDFRPAPDTPYYRALTLPGPDTVIWGVVSHLLCHSVDFISMALLRRTLPNTDKQIQLPVNLKELSEVLEVVGNRRLDELVLVHPGRHWESKTFPVKWWQEVVDGLAEIYQVCLIGKDEKTRGCVELDVPDGAIDTRNLLSLRGLVSLINSASVLVSNDSAPIHIAGSSDIGIVLVPTCKHPDHLLPWRNGSQGYKALALYKSLMCDDYESAPTTIYGSLGDYVTGEWSDYLPEPSEVVNSVECLRSV